VHSGAACEYPRGYSACDVPETSRDRQCHPSSKGGRKCRVSKQLIRPFRKMGKQAGGGLPLWKKSTPSGFHVHKCPAGEVESL